MGHLGSVPTECGGKSCSCRGLQGSTGLTRQEEEQRANAQLQHQDKTSICTALLKHTDGDPSTMPSSHNLQHGRDHRSHLHSPGGSGRGTQRLAQGASSSPSPGHVGSSPGPFTSLCRHSLSLLTFSISFKKQKASKQTTKEKQPLAEQSCTRAV